MAYKNLQVIESELNFLRGHVQNILTEDFEGIDEAYRAINSALQSLKKYKLSLRPTYEEDSVLLSAET